MRIWCVACLACLAGVLAGHAQKGKQPKVDGKVVVGCKTRPSVPVLVFHDVTVAEARLADGSTCTLVKGAVVSHLRVRNIRFRVEIDVTVVRDGTSPPMSRGRVVGYIAVPKPATVTPFMLAGAPFRDFTKPLKDNERVVHRIVLYGWALGESNKDYDLQ